MQYIYNINKVGSLTNSRGVLSGFSSSNYATIDKNTDITNSFEFAFKFTTASDVSTLQVICMGNVDQQGVRIEVSGSKFGLLCGVNNSWITTTSYQGGTVQANTTYWVKAKFDGSSQYTLDVSTDGSTYSTVVSYTSSSTVTSDFDNYLLGIYSDLTQGIFKGTIDLNESSITIDNNIVWQGVTIKDSVRIQLRHDTAANWTSVNPVLLEGEVGVETDTNKQKVGDGTTAWNDLPYNINYDSFDLPIQKYVAQTGTTWDETKLTYNSSTKVFTPTDSTENRTVYPITFNIPNNINIHSYNDSWRIYIPNNTFQSKTGANFDSCSCQIFAESGQIAQLWYSANSWRKGTFEGGQVCTNMNSSVSWEINHRNNYGPSYIYPYNLRVDTSDLNYGFTYNANSGNLTKVVIFVNTGMNSGVLVGDLRLCTLDSSGNILEEYPLFTESAQPQIKLSYNSDNLTVNSNNQLDTTVNLSEINNKVDKSGDTMTGSLTVPQLTLENNRFTRFITKCDSWERGTNPSEDTSCGLIMEDKNSNGTAAHRFGEVVVQSNSSGSTHITIMAYKNQVANASTSLQIGYNAAGNVYTSAPACDLNNSIVTTVSHTYSSANNTINAVKFGNGLIINWGRVSLNGVISSSNKVITFAIPYTTNAKVVASRNANAGQATPVVVGWEGTTSFTIGCPSGSSSTGYVNFIAIGY